MEGGGELLILKGSISSQPSPYYKERGQMQVRQISTPHQHMQLYAADSESEQGKSAG